MDDQAVEDRLSDLRVQVRRTQILTDRDKELKSYMRDFVRNREDCVRGGGGKCRGLFVIGETNSGKTFSIERQLALFPAFQPTINEYGEVVQRMLCIVLPRSCTEKTLPLEVLKKLGVPGNRKMEVEDLYDLMATQLRERGVHYLWIDEAQHLLRADTPATKQKIQNSLKNLLQLPDFPLHVIFSGVSTTLGLREGDGQMVERSTVMPFRALHQVADRKLVKRCLKETALACRVRVPPELLEDEFAERLCRASKWALGTVIVRAQESCFLGLDRGKAEVSMQEFARVYTRATGCRRSDNMFVSKDWRSLDPKNAMSDLEGAEGRETVGTRTRSKRS